MPTWHTSQGFYNAHRATRGRWNPISAHYNNSFVKAASTHMHQSCLILLAGNALLWSCPIVLLLHSIDHFDNENDILPQWSDPTSLDLVKVALVQTPL